MASSPSQRDLDQIQIRRCLDGDGESMKTLREAHHSVLLGVLIKRGASPVEAEDLVADMWGDCVGREDRPSLLEKYSGKCALRSWLLTVATNRLIDQKRRGKFRGELSRGKDGERDAAADPIEQVAAPEPEFSGGEPALVDLLRSSLEAAFETCPPDALLILRLVYLHGLTQREAGRLWGWHESKVSRQLSQAMEAIQKTTLKEIRRKDAWLQLTWADFVQLCRDQQVGFL